MFQGTTGVYAWDGSAGWRVSPLDGSLEPEPLPAEDAALAAEQADIDGPLVDRKAKGHTVELVGKEALPGGPAHRLKVTLRSGAVRHVWVDAVTGLVVQTASTRTLRGREVALETTAGSGASIVTVPSGSSTSRTGPCLTGRMSNSGAFWMTSSDSSV